MTSASALSEEARRAVHRLVWIARAGGVAVAAVLGLATVVIQRHDLTSAGAIAGYVVVVIGLMAYLVISTITRVGHARIIERSLAEVKQLSDKLRHLAERDSLTGLLNAGAFHAVLEDAVIRARASRQSVSLIVADLDNFKVLNDSYGHQFGDAVLREAAAIFATCGGDTAIAARPGGDEFAILLPQATRSDAVAVAREIEERLRSITGGDGQATVTLGSFGVATFPADGDSAQALFAAADGRMYSEKHRRKAAALANAAGAARGLFVRAGRAMRPQLTATEVFEEIAAAALEEFSLIACLIAVPQSKHHPPIVVVHAGDDAVEDACIAAVRDGPPTAAEVARVLPPEAWVIDTAIPNEDGEPGLLLFAGLPSASFRPDASVVIALAELLQAIVTNARARADAVRAGRERDIYVELAHALAGEAPLAERLRQAVKLVEEFLGAANVTIEGVRSRRSDARYNVMSSATPEFLEQWQRARESASGRDATRRVIDAAPFVASDVANDDRLPELERQLIAATGIREVAVVPIKFAGEALGLLGAASEHTAFFTEERVAQMLTIAQHLAAAINVALLREQLEASSAQIEQASRESLRLLADAAEARDPNTGGHLRRIRHYAYELALEMGCAEQEAAAIADASTVHDLGKLRLPDAVLMNPGRLTEDEWELVRLHPVHGARLIGDSPAFDVERAVARWHHERWDGSGYPDGLRGEEIPLAARIVAVADAFDALTTERPYKRAWSVEDAIAEVRRMRGSMFCPGVVDALERLWSRGAFQAATAASEEIPPRREAA